MNLINATRTESLFEEPVQSYDAWMARRIQLTSDAEITARVAESIDSLIAVMREGFTLKIGFSGGKDSSVLLAVAIEAVLKLKSEGFPVEPLYVTSAATLVEHPEVSAAVSHALDCAAEYCETNGIEFVPIITTPRLTEDWWVRIIGGDQLPSFIGGSSKCSSDLKIGPQARVARKIDLDLKRRGKKPSIALIGTRYSESTKRKGNMMARKESVTVPGRSAVGGVSVLTLSPIANWETETVFAFLQNAGRNKRYRAFAENFDSLYGLYDSASGGECVLYVDPGMKSREAGGCDARMGCWTCQMVSSDHSMRNMLLLPEYQYMRGLYQLREYLAATRYDYTRRRWFGRSVDPETGDLMLSVATYSAAECERLLRMVLTLDKRERERAAKMADDLASGAVPPTEANRRMAKTRFQSLTLKQIAAIDVLWSMNISHPPHRAWRVLEEVLDGRGEMTVPSMDVAPHVPVPEHRILPGNLRRWDRTSGLHDIMLSSALFEPEGITHREDEDGTISAIPQFQDNEFFDIDEESLSMFLQFELDDVLRRSEGLTADHALSAVRFYHRYGLVKYSHSRAYLVERRIVRAEYWLSFGLAGDLPYEEMVKITVPMADRPGERMRDAVEPRGLFDDEVSAEVACT